MRARVLVLNDSIERFADKLTLRANTGVDFCQCTTVRITHDTIQR